MSFSENLKNIRAEKSLSQEQLAELLGVSRQAVSKWEQDNSYPETEKLIQMAQALDVSLDYLLLDKKPAENSKPPTKSDSDFFGGERRIAITVSDDGDYYLANGAISTYYKFQIVPVFGAGKNDPKFVINGIDRSGFLGEHYVPVGWYTSDEDAHKELREIYEAMQNGESVYQLKYNAKLKKGKFGGIKLAREED